jgi:hypothetical protein
MSLSRALSLSFFLSCFLAVPATAAPVMTLESSQTPVDESGEPESVLPVPSAPAFSLIYEGETGGISGASAALDLDSAVSAALAGREGAEWSRIASG